MKIFISQIKDWASRLNFCCLKKKGLNTNLMERLSHELRTSLTGIVGYSEFVESTSTEPMVNFTAKIIKESSQVLARTSNAFFDLQSIENGSLKLSANKFSFVNLVREVIRFHQRLANDRDLIIKMSCSSDLYLVEMIADEGRVRQAVDALIFGAIQYANKDDSIQVEIGMDKLLSQMQFSIGFPQADSHNARIKLLNEFWGSHDYKFRLQEGPGVELAMAKALIGVLEGAAEYNVHTSEYPRLIVSLPICSSYSKECM